MANFNQEYIAGHIQCVTFDSRTNEIALKIVEAMDRVPFSHSLAAALTREFVALAMSRTATLEHWKDAAPAIQNEFVCILRNFVNHLLDCDPDVPRHITKHIFDLVCRPFQEGAEMRVRWQGALATLEGKVLVYLLSDKPSFAVNVWQVRTRRLPLGSQREEDEFNVHFIEPFFRSVDPWVRIAVILGDIVSNPPSVTEYLVRCHVLDKYPGSLDDVPMAEFPSEWVVALCFSVVIERDKDKNEAKLCLSSLESTANNNGRLVKWTQHDFIAEVARLLGILRDSNATIGQLAIAMNGANWLPFGQDHAQVVRNSNDQLLQELNNYAQNKSLANIIIGFI